MPTPWPSRRSIFSVQLLTQLGLDLGLSLELCLRDSGLGPAQLTQPNAEIEAASELQLIANLIQALPAVTNLGLQAGRRYRLTTYGAWGYALLNSATVRQAAELGLRYHSLTYAFTRLSLSEAIDGISLYFDGSALPAPLHDFIVQRDMLAALQVVSELLGTPRPLLTVEMRQAAPADPAAFYEAFGQLPNFSAPCNRLIFPPELLDQPLPRANPQLAEACEAQCRALLARRQWQQGLAGRVRTLLLNTTGPQAGMEQIARQLNLSSRTLRRRLEAEGTRFRTLQDEVRLALAEELLASSRLTLEEIAERLGYGELSNFIHAFRRWKGVTPGRYQREMADAESMQTI